MWKLLDQILNQFHQCFTRKATFNWFVIIVVGLMIRTDKLGLTSIVRDLNLLPTKYECMVHFFRSEAWKLQNLTQQWMKCVKGIAPIYLENKMTILVGDGVKQSKEARKMPAVRKHHQESENSSKAEYIFGHLWGGIGVLAGHSKKMFCIPLSLKLHSGVDCIRSWEDNSVETGSHVVELIKDGFEATKIFGKALLLLDRYYLSAPALKTLEILNKNTDTVMHILVNAKKSCKAYTKPVKSKKPGKGRPRKKGDPVKLKELFTKNSKEFTKAILTLYGKKEEIEYLAINLLWGQGLYKELRFVLVKYKGKYSILATTKLDLSPTKIIELYAYRFKIECTFRELKQIIGGFCYQFWTKIMPKLNRFAKKGAKNPLEEITPSEDKSLIVNTVKAIEGYVLLSAIALGLLQILSLKFSEKMSLSKYPIRYLRTQSNIIHSEATVACFLRKSIFYVFRKNSKLGISKIIKSKQIDVLEYEQFLAS